MLSTCNREVVGSNPTWVERSSSSVGRALKRAGHFCPSRNMGDNTGVTFDDLQNM